MGIHRRALLLSALLAAFLTPGAAAAGGHVAILQYHNFGDDTPPSTSVTVPQFTAHLDYLERNGFSVWPLAKAVAALQEGTPLPDRCVVITIDDALASVASGAFPLLKSRGLPFTVFVATESVDRGFKGYLTWDELRRMGEAGATVASHGHRHGYLVRREPGESEEQWAARVREDVELSQESIRREMGEAPPFFAYPYGEYDDALRRIVRALGLVAFAQRSGPAWEGSDFASLPRFPMASRFAEISSFAEKVNSLPLPVLRAEPEETLLPPGEALPVLNLVLAPGDYRPEALSCYSGAQGRIKTTRLDGAVQVVANAPLPPGRSLYTCTAPHVSQNRYFWYSHLWIRREAP